MIKKFIQKETAIAPGNGCFFDHDPLISFNFKPGTLYMIPFDADNIPFQQAASFIYQTGKHLFITGNAGTGKTTFLKYIRETSIKKMVVVAPTGVAAINAGGVTIHSLFQIPPGIFLPSGMHHPDANGLVHTPVTLMRNLRMNSAKKELLRELELLVIDEVSMLRADMLDAIDLVLRKIRKQPHLPYGGVQVLYIGDLYQLPPVTQNHEWSLLQDHYRSPFFFDALVIKNEPPVYIELKKIYRQSDPRFIELLNKIRNNQCSADDLLFLNSFYRQHIDPEEASSRIILTTHNHKADAINRNRLQQLPGELFTFRAEISGDFSEKAYPADVNLQLKAGAQVMFIKNDKGDSRRYFNGKIAVIESINEETITISMPGESSSLTLEKETWRNMRYQYDKEKDTFEEEEIGHFIQYPIKLAWAITIHKSQGLTFDQAVIDAGASFAAGQVYVALSRLTSISGLVLLSRVQPWNISTDPNIHHFAATELPVEKLGSLLQAGQQEFIAASLKKPFDWQKIIHFLEELHRQYASPLLPQNQNPMEWCNELLMELNGYQQVAEKFHKQLRGLLESHQGTYDQLHQRTLAAQKYFLRFCDELLLPVINKQLAGDDGVKRTKAFLKQIEILLMLAERQQKYLLQIGAVTAAMTRQQQQAQVLDLVNELYKPVPVSSVVAVPPKQKKEKGATQKQSLQMYREGLPIKEIALKRNLSINTIETHLCSFIPTGEMDVSVFVSKEKLEIITAYLNQHTGTGLADAKHHLGEEFSYTELKAALKYNELLATQKQDA